MTDASPTTTAPRLARSTYILAGCGVAFLFGVPVVIIVALTLLGGMLETNFEAVQAEICKADPSDPRCR